ncbi:MAG: DUF2079 domain-containing protein [Patescibacteria group bacterium]|nr:DUF2079 domain-containing protein [Patescibacteria group bacterium]
MFLTRIKEKLEKNSLFFLFLAIFIYTLIIFLLCIKKYNGFDYTSFDLAIFNQVFFNTSQGRFLDMTINLHNYLGDHFNPIIFLLLPFYTIKASPLTLLFLQSLFIALAAWPLYLITEKINRSKLTALAVAGLWLVNPFLHNVNFYEFHLLTILPFLFFWTFYFYRQGSWRLFILIFILSLFVREDAALLLFAFSPVAWLDKRSLKWIIFPLLASVAYFLLAMAVLGIFAESGNYAYLVYYSWLGGDSMGSIILAWLSDPLAVILHIFTLENISIFLFLFCPLIFLPFIRPKYLLFMAVPSLQFLLSKHGFTFLTHSTQYAVPLLCGIFLALVYSFGAIGQKNNFFPRSFICRHFSFIKIALFFSALYFLLFLSPVPKILIKDYQSDKIKLKKEFVELIGPDDRVVVDFNFLPILSNRTVTYPMYYAFFRFSQFVKNRFILPPVDYILVDSEEHLKLLAQAVFIDKPELKKIATDNWRQTLADYNLVKALDNMLLWQDKNQNDYSLPLYHFAPFSEEKPINNREFLQDKEYFTGEVNKLKLTFIQSAELDDQVLLRFFATDYYFDVPLGYGLWPPSSWPKDQLAIFYYYLNKDIDSFQIFSWQGENKLGAVMEVVLELKLEKLSERIYFK